MPNMGIIYKQGVFFIFDNIDNRAQLIQKNMAFAAHT